jgi:predicted RNase H-like HicB family nuclease
MNFKVIVHPAEEGGFWAEVPAILGCATQGDTLDELWVNVREAIDACLSVDLSAFEMAEDDEIFELAV